MITKSGAPYLGTGRMRPNVLAFNDGFITATTYQGTIAYEDQTGPFSFTTPQ